jgi:feruloyl esterase
MELAGVVITAAGSAPAGPYHLPLFPGAPPSQDLQLPATCLVQGTADRRTGAAGKEFGIGFELRMPDPWNGRFLFQGGGGTDGTIRPALGLVSFDRPPALAQGFAVVSTDAGHEGVGDMSFGQDQQARIDYAYRAIDRVTVLAKQIVTRFYGKPPEKSYFVGCSNGGRQGMIAAQRFPSYFDGIVAGDPGFRLSYAAVAEVWDTQALLVAAPKDAEGHAILSQALTSDDLTLLGQAILSACDEKDGLKDGLVDNPGACHFDPAVLECKGEKTAQCLARAQVQAVKKVFAGAVNSRGEQVYSGWPWDPGVASPAWRAWKLGFSKTAVPDALNVSLGFAAVRGYFMTPYDPTFDPLKFDFDKDTIGVAETAAMNDAVATQLSTFAARGAKLLIYQGMADPAFSATDIIAYYDKLAADNGGIEPARNWARLFLIPGMCHCSGGPALDQFDPLAAIVDWVEQGKAPDSIPAKGRAFPGRTRPLCAYPRETRYKGTGSIDDPANFACR